MDPPVRVGGSAGLNTTSSSLPYAWLERGNKGQGSLASLPIARHVGMLATFLPL